MKISRFFFAAAILLAPAAFAGTITYTGALSNAGEATPNTSTGTGQATVILNDVANTLEVIVSFSGLSGTTTASHIHCCTGVAFSGSAGVATQTPTFSGFPLGVTSGTFDQTFDLTLAATYNPAFVTAQGSVAAAEAAIIGGLNSGKSYLNIHTSLYPTGEIRAFLVPTPEPGTLSLGAAIAGGFALLARFRSRRSRSV